LLILEYHNIKKLINVNPNHVPTECFMKFQSWQLSFVVSSIAVIALGSIMAVTNPRREAYQTYATQKLSVYLKNEVCTDLGNFLKGQCNQMVNQGQGPITQMIAQSTQRHNYLVFSIYETELSLMTGLPSYQFKTLGIFQNFWIYEAKQQ